MGIMPAEIGGVKFMYREETHFPVMGYSWDVDVFLEVIKTDAYRLLPLRDLRPAPKTILDIGANIGAFTLFAKTLWPEARITCVEPFGPNMDLLKINCNKINDITFVQKAVVGAQRRQGKAPFTAPAFARKTENNGNGGDGQLDDMGDIEVDICGLDDLIPDEGFDLVKMDCEGAELQIITEANKMDLFPKLRVIRGETHSLEIERVISKILVDHYWYSVDFKGVLGIFSADYVQKT